MRPLLAAALLLASTAAVAAPAAPARRVAVLDFSARWASKCGEANLSDAQEERCEALRLFADEARGGALAVLRPPAFVVMTRENTAQILKDMGGQCTEGECEVETARLLGASVVVSGEVTFMEGTWLVSIKVHDVATAALLGTGRTEGKSKLEAFRNVRAETERTLRAAVGLDGSAPPVVAAPPRAVEPSSPTPSPPAPPPPERTPPEPPAAVTPAAGAVEPGGGRRWWGELLAGIPVMQAADPGFDVSGSGRRTSGIAMGLRAGRRWTPSWSFDATIEMHEAPGYQCDLADYSLKATGLMIGAAWRPRANPYLSVALSAGVARANSVLSLSRLAGGGSTSSSQTTTFGRLGLRVEYPFRDLSVGLESGVVLLPLESMELWSAPLSRYVRFNPGTGYFVVPLQTSVKYRF